MKDEQRETIRRLFWLPHGGADEAACAILYGLAKEAESPIVLLGASTGLAAVALGFGSEDGHHQRVFALSETDEQMRDFIGNVVEAGVRRNVDWTKGPYRKGARRTLFPVGLVVWDTGRGPDLVKDFAAWQEKIVEGGVFAVHGNRTAWPMLVDYAVAGGLWQKGIVRPEAQIGTLRKLDYG